MPEVAEIASTPTQTSIATVISPGTKGKIESKPIGKTESKQISKKTEKLPEDTNTSLHQQVKDTQVKRFLTFWKQKNKESKQKEILKGETRRSLLKRVAALGFGLAGMSDFLNALVDDKESLVTTDVTWKKHWSIEEGIHTETYGPGSPVDDAFKKGDLRAHTWDKRSVSNIATRGYHAPALMLTINSDICI